jgi:alanine-synthesizing transaminase
MKYISSKFHFNKTPNPLSIKLNEVKKRGLPYIDLTVSNPTVTGLVYPEAEIKAYLTKNEIFKYNPSPKGLIAARYSIAKYYLDRGRHVKPSQLYLTASSSESMSFLIKLFCEHGDELLAPAPGYPLYDFIALLEGVFIKKYQIILDESESKPRYRIDFSYLERAITRKTKAIIVTQPNNPLGNNLSQNDVSQLLELAEKYNLAVIIDEVFADFTINNTYTHVISNRVPVIILNGFSKVLALPQLKLGWIYLEGSPDFIKEAGDSLEIITDTYLTVNTSVMVATEGLLSLRWGIQSQISKRIIENLEFLEKNVGGGISFIKPDGGWYVVLRIDIGMNDELFSIKLLDHRSVYVHPGYMFDFIEGCNVIVSLLTPIEVLAEGLRMMHEFIEFTKQSHQ